MRTSSAAARFFRFGAELAKKRRKTVRAAANVDQRVARDIGKSRFFKGARRKTANFLGFFEIFS